MGEGQIDTSLICTEAVLDRTEEGDHVNEYQVANKMTGHTLALRKLSLNPSFLS